MKPGGCGIVYKGKRSAKFFYILWKKNKDELLKIRNISDFKSG